MVIVKLISAYSILVLLSLFLFANTMKLGDGTGYGYLAAMFVPVLILTLITKNYYQLAKVKLSTILLAIFLSYFIMRYLIDTMDLQRLKAVTIGTSGGVLFSLVIGIISAYAITNIYKLRITREAPVATLVVSLFYIILTIFLTKQSLNFHLTDISLDYFLIENQEGKYQRVGDFFFIQFLLTGAIISVLFITMAKQFKRIKVLSLLALYTISAFLFAITSQLIGSNSGFAGAIGFLIVFYMYTFLIVSKSPANEFKSITLSALLFGSLGLKVLKGLLIFAVLLLLLFFYASHKMNIDITRFRVAGFDSGEISSISSRLELLKNNFITHISYNPIFGNAQVEVLTTGKGTYVHSLPFSLLTHTGIIGFFLFSFVIIRMYKEIAYTSSKMHSSLNNNKSYGLFRLFALASVIILGTVKAHFVWIPLWFAIGLFGLSFVVNNKVQD